MLWRAEELWWLQVRLLLGAALRAAERRWWWCLMRCYGLLRLAWVTDALLLHVCPSVGTPVLWRHLLPCEPSLPAPLLWLRQAWAGRGTGRGQG